MSSIDCLETKVFPVLGRLVVIPPRVVCAFPPVPFAGINGLFKLDGNKLMRNNVIEYKFGRRELMTALGVGDPGKM